MVDYNVDPKNYTFNDSFGFKFKNYPDDLSIISKRKILENLSKLKTFSNKQITLLNYIVDLAYIICDWLKDEFVLVMSHETYIRFNGTDDKEFIEFILSCKN